MAARAVPAPLAVVPNLLTVGRLILIPIFAALVLVADGGHSWAAAIVFGAAGATDQVDGWLARRWRVESEFGKIADPLADRLMIDAAVILLFIADHMPWAGLVVIVGRDLLLMAGYKLIASEGPKIEVNFVGKAATWLLYASLALTLMTRAGTDWPLVIFWAGVALAIVSGVLYVVKAWREVRP